MRCCTKTNNLPANLLRKVLHHFKVASATEMCRDFKLCFFTAGEKFRQVDPTESVPLHWPGVWL